MSHLENLCASFCLSRLKLGIEDHSTEKMSHCCARSNAGCPVASLLTEH